MNRQHENKTVVITGASSGIGSAVARLLHAQGAAVVLAARSIEKLETLAAELGPGAVPIQLDVSDELNVNRAFEEIKRSCGKVDVLINNAGFGLFETVLDSHVSAYQRMMNVNYFGTVRCTKAVLPDMLAAGSGHIVNVASIASKVATAKSAGYSATKHAVLGFTNALRQELQGTGVFVTAIHPGPVRTPFFAIADPEGGYVRNVQRFMVSPERVAASIASVLGHRKAEVHIPPWMGAGAKLVQALPVDWMTAVAARFLKLK